MRVFIVSCLLLLGCFPGASFAGKKTDQASQPCWFGQPVTTTRTGAIGAARNLNAGTGNPVQFSRYRALQGLAVYLGVELDFKRRDLPLEQNSFELGGQQVSLADDFVEGGQVYSYAYLGGAGLLESGCQKPKCKLSSCSPSWLCEAQGTTASLLGTSYRAADKSSQMRIATKNALSQLEPLYGLDVKAKDNYLLGQTSVGAIRVLQSRGSITRHQLVENLDLKYIMTHRCSNDEDLYVRVNIPGLEGVKSPMAADKWMKNPSPGRVRGAIGSVTGRVASGLLSDKIKLAVRRGLVALAQAKSAKVSERLLNVKRDNGGYIISHITQETEVTIRARVNDIYFERNSKGIAVYAWIVEESGESQQSL